MMHRQSKLKWYMLNCYRNMMHNAELQQQTNVLHHNCSITIQWKVLIATPPWQFNVTFKIATPTWWFNGRFWNPTMWRHWIM